MCFIPTQISCIIQIQMSDYYSKKKVQLTVNHQTLEHAATCKMVKLIVWRAKTRKN